MIFRGIHEFKKTIGSRVKTAIGPQETREYSPPF